MKYIIKIFRYLALSINTLFFFLKKKNIDDKSVLIISNGMSMSGAPLVLQNVISYFQSRGFNPVVLYEHDGKLRDECNCATFCCFFFEKIIQKLAIRYDYDYIFVNTIASHKWITFFEKENIKYNLWIHEGEEYFSKLSSDLPACLQYAKVLCVSNITIDCLKKYNLSCNYSLLPYPFDEFDNVKNYDFTSGKNKIILLVGSICRRKNQIELLEAISRLEHRLLDGAQFVFIGSSIEDNYSKQFYSRAKKLKCVRIIDFMPNNDLMNYYDNVYLTVCTSTDDPLPVSITEAIYKKRLVLVSNKCGQYSMLRSINYPYTYHVNDINELVLKIESALNESELNYLQRTQALYSLSTDLFNRNLFNSKLSTELIRTTNI